MTGGTECRRGDWIQTFTGRCFWPLDPRPEDVHIQDIAHALSMKCRYAGHTIRFYSVAEHSVLVSHAVPPEHALWALLHDAAEAYSADIPRPLKRDLKEWEPIESRIMAAIATRFRLDGPEPRPVKDADMAICADERAAIMTPCEQEWDDLPDPLGAKILGLLPVDAELLFLERFEKITGIPTEGWREPTYPNPEHGWTCFHCGETFRSPRSARFHFGATPIATPACQIKAEEGGLVRALRLVQDELARRPPAVTRTDPL